MDFSDLRSSSINCRYRLNPEIGLDASSARRTQIRGGLFSPKIFKMHQSAFVIGDDDISIFAEHIKRLNGIAAPQQNRLVGTGDDVAQGRRDRPFRRVLRFRFRRLRTVEVTDKLVHHPAHFLLECGRRGGVVGSRGCLSGCKLHSISGMIRHRHENHGAQEYQHADDSIFKTSLRGGRGRF